MPKATQLPKATYARVSGSMPLGEFWNLASQRLHSSLFWNGFQPQTIINFSSQVTFHTGSYAYNYECIAIAIG